MASALGRPRTSQTASRCTTQTARGTHAFEIADYSLHRGVGEGRFVASAAFAVGGYDWRLRFYPDGAGAAAAAADPDCCDDHVAVFLELLTKGAEARAHFDLRLAHQQTTAERRAQRRPSSSTSSSSIVSTKTPVLFSTAGGAAGMNAYGDSRFMRRSQLEKSSYLRDDRLVIECDVTVVGEPDVVDTTESYGYGSSSSSKRSAGGRSRSRRFTLLPTMCRGVSVVVCQKALPFVRKPRL